MCLINLFSMTSREQTVIGPFPIIKYPKVEYLWSFKSSIGSWRTTLVSVCPCTNSSKFTNVIYFLGTYPIKFHSDNCTEMTNSKIKELLSPLHIGNSFSTLYVKRQNGVVESSMCHLVNTTTAILISSKLPKFLWNKLLVEHQTPFNKLIISNFQFKDFLVLSSICIRTNR